MTLAQEKIDSLKRLTGATTDQAAMEIALDRALAEVQADEQIRQALRERWAAADAGGLDSDRVFPAGRLPADARYRLKAAGVKLAGLPPPKRHAPR